LQPRETTPSERWQEKKEKRIVSNTEKYFQVNSLLKELSVQQTGWAELAKKIHI